MMAIPGSSNVSPGAALGDMGVQPYNMPAMPNISPNGAFEYTIPIEAPPGTRHFAPHVALVYSSSSGDGYVGMGWHLSGISSIARCAQTIAQDGFHGGVNFDNQDRFCLDGQRLILTSGTTYGAAGSQYHTEIESFRKIVAGPTSGSGPASFDVWTKDGTHYQYGYNTATTCQNSGARIFAPDGSTLRVWVLTQVTDSSGNYICYSYTDNAAYGEYEPSRIDYTGNINAGTGPTNSIRFAYKSRRDQIPTYQAGQLIKPQYLLTNIQTWHGSSEILNYSLGYNEVNTAQWPTGSVWHNELNQLTLCDANGDCLAPTKFSWWGQPSNWTMSSPTDRYYSYGQALSAGDYNADGLTDGFAYGTSCSAGSEIYFGAQDGSFGNTTPQTEDVKFDYWAPYGNQTVQTYNGPACFYPYQDSQAGIPYTVDLNGDGWSDLIVPVWETFSPNPLLYYQVLLNNQQALLPQANTDGSLPQIATIFGDFNGDSRVDMLAMGLPYSYPYLGDGKGGFNKAVSEQFATDTEGEISTGDFDGSGCTGVLEQSAAQSDPAYQFFFCHTPGAATSAVVTNWTYNKSGNTIVLGDYNGDGKTDALVVNATNATIYFGTGAGFDGGRAVTGSRGWSAYNISTGDFNGDGRTDLVLVPKSGGSVLVDLSVGNDFVSAASISGAPSGVVPVIADWNNDGASDLWLQMPSGGHDEEYTFSYTPELMTAVDNGIGDVTTVSYDRLNHGTIYTKGSGQTYPNEDVVAPIYVVSQESRSNGIGGTSKWNYTYSGLIRNVQGYGSRFTNISVTDQQTQIQKTVQYYTWFPLYGAPWTETDIASNGSGTTLSTVTHSYNANNLGGNPGTGAAYFFVTPSETWTSNNDLDGTALPSANTTYSYDDMVHGNIAQRVVTTTYGTQSSSSTVTNTYNYDDNDWIVNAPKSSTIENVVGTSDMKRVDNFYEQHAPGLVSEVDIEPDHLADPLGLVVKLGYDGWGNLASADYSGSNIVERSAGITYDTNTGELPTKATNALNQTDKWTFDQNFGGPLQLVDPNGQTTTWTPDWLGRPSLMTKPDRTNVATKEYYCAGVYNGGSPYTCPTNGAFDVVTTYTGTDGKTQNAPTQVTFYDSLGRVIAQDTQSFDGSTFSRVATQYDGSGNVQAVSRPYFVAGGTAQWTNYLDDALHRVIQATRPDGTVDSYGYDGLTASVTLDLKGKQQTTTTLRNAQGLVASVADSNNGVTSYAYDAFGDPISATSPGNHTVSNGFDLRGRKTSSSDPDLGSWQYQYDNLSELIGQTSPAEYAKGETTTLGWDVLGRLTARTEPDMTSNWDYDHAPNGIGFVDQATCSPPAGQQGSTSACASGNYVRSYAYDSLSRPSSVTVSYGGQSPYTSSETYDALSGQLLLATAFSGFQTTNTYNAAGYLSQIASPTGAVYWTANAADADMHLTQETAGSGSGAVTTTHGFDPLTGRLLATSAGTDADFDNLADLSYSWDTLGNLTNRTDTLQNYDENFCYDSLNRLTNYAVNDGGGGDCRTGTIEKTVSYDNGQVGDGNITGKSDIGLYSYGQYGAGPHAVTSINTSPTPGGCGLAACKVDGIGNPNFYYDADGNMLCVTTRTGCDLSAARSYSWTSFDMVATLASGANNAALAYTPEHRRGSLTTNGVTTYYFSNPDAGVTGELAAGSSPVWRTYLAPYGHIVAEFFLAGGVWTPYYFVGDHLSSTTVLADANGSSKEYDSYDAWGLRRYQNGADAPTGCNSLHPSSLTLRGYTGQEMMDSFCLVNLNARMYDPGIGRVLSADPVTAYPYDGQNFNRYSYVENGPLSMVDPSGYVETVIVQLHKKYDAGGQDLGGPGGNADTGLSGDNSGGGGDHVETVVVRGQRQHNLPTVAYQFELAQLLGDLLSPGGSTESSDKVKQAICGKSASGKILGSMGLAAGVGFGLGAYSGFISGEILGGWVSFGTSGIPGALIGGTIVGTLGAMRGFYVGSAEAATCSAAGAYGG